MGKHTIEHKLKRLEWEKWTCEHQIDSFGYLSECKMERAKGSIYISRKEKWKIEKDKLPK